MVNIAQSILCLLPGTQGYQSTYEYEVPILLRDSYGMAGLEQTSLCVKSPMP